MPLVPYSASIENENLLDKKWTWVIYSLTVLRDVIRVANLHYRYTESCLGSDLQFLTQRSRRGPYTASPYQNSLIPTSLTRSNSNYLQLRTQNFRNPEIGKIFYYFLIHSTLFDTSQSGMSLYPTTLSQKPLQPSIILYSLFEPIHAYHAPSSR